MVERAIPLGQLCVLVAEDRHAVHGAAAAKVLLELLRRRRVVDLHSTYNTLLFVSEHIFRGGGQQGGEAKILQVNLIE